MSCNKKDPKEKQNGRDEIVQCCNAGYVITFFNFFVSFRFSWDRIAEHKTKTMKT
jgi:hypothetical protein